MIRSLQPSLGVGKGESRLFSVDSFDKLGFVLLMDQAATSMDSSDFQPILEKHQVLMNQLGISESQQAQLATYLQRLALANQQMNLFSRKLSAKQLVEDHLFDCLAALTYFPHEGQGVDLGSGGGLPAIPLAICRPLVAFKLFEKSPKKRQFLSSLMDLCPRIEICGLVEPRSLDGPIDFVTARAFKPIHVILELTRHYANRGGKYLLYKGRLARIQEELQQAKLGKLQATSHPLTIVGSADERYLVELKASFAGFKNTSLSK